MSDKIYPSMVIRSQAEAIELLKQENKELKDRINQTRNTIETTISIIKQQPSSDKELDLYLINQLERYLNLLKEDKK